MIKINMDDMEFRCFGEESAVHCGTCGEVLSLEKGYYKKDGIPYCRGCLQSFSGEEYIRICGIGEENWLKLQGFASVGRVEYGRF